MHSSLHACGAHHAAAAEGAVTQLKITRHAVAAEGAVTQLKMTHWAAAAEHAVIHAVILS